MTLLLLVVGCGILFSLTVPNFSGLANFLSIADSLVFDVIITTGMTIALVSGGFDLSVGSVFASSGVVVAVAMVAGLPVWLSIIIALLAAAAWGLLNGLVITKIGVNPLLTTLATMGMARGFVYILTEGRVVTGFPDEFTAPGQAAFGRVSVLVLIALLVVIVADVLLRKSAFLRPRQRDQRRASAHRRLSYYRTFSGSGGGAFDLEVFSGDPPDGYWRRIEGHCRSGNRRG
jgi:ribose transport system permease protein